MTSQAQKIVRVLQVVDTREYELIGTPRGERYMPVPGSGNERECDRCGRLHVVHAHVELADGSSAIVGTGCMGAADMTKEARRLASQARKAAAEAAERRHDQAIVDAVRDALASLPEPPAAVVSKHADGERNVYTVGDASAMTYPCKGWPEGDRKNAEQAVLIATAQWRRNRIRDLGFSGKARRLADWRGLFNSAA